MAEHGGTVEVLKMMVKKGLESDLNFCEFAVLG